ncbi:MAG: hypothetical protein K2J77_13120 [Oscillospiraceae bacterium]|nr:hypothetical protein [Oscillospiraceae bacterium]
MNKSRIFPIARLVIVAATILCIVGIYTLFNFNDTEYTITVTDKERVFAGGEGGESKYLVFGDDTNGNALVFENTDTFIRGKWNSSNIQGQLKIGGTYTITVVGYRIPFLSSYQNIIKVQQEGAAE